jgi:hypothetical protein
LGADVIRDAAGKHSSALPAGAPTEIIHADDLVMLP